MVILQDITADSPVWLKLLDSGLTIFILSVGIVVLWKMWKQTQDKITNYNETDRKRAEDIIAKNTDAINKNTGAFEEMREVFMELKALLKNNGSTDY